MRIRTEINVHPISGEIAAVVEILDGDVVLARGVSERGGAGMAPPDTRTSRDHLVAAARNAIGNFERKAKIAAEAVHEFLQGARP